MQIFYRQTIKNWMLACTVFLTGSVFAQTNPTPQSLPYSQDFSGLLHSSTTYPTGLQGWKVSSAATTSFVTTGPTGDQALVASSSASSTAGGVHNYNGKIGTLASGSTNPGLALALNTTGKSNIQVNYDIMVIRNPYDGGSNTRLNEATLQYRIGTSGAFTTLTGIEYQSGTTNQTTSGVTTPQNLESRSIVLPAACDNQAEIQIRWISRDMTGAGSRPSFAVDNISVDADSDADTYYSAVDCNDNDAAVNPGATEICNFIDDDCNGVVDDGITYLSYYTDADLDGFGAGLAANYCSDPGAGFALTADDCDDTQITVYPGATEVCDGLDNDCNGNIDENVVSAVISPAGIVTTCKGVGTTLTANAGVGYTYQWFKNGNLISGATSDSYTTSKPAYYQVQVTAPGGCFVLSDVVEVNVSANPNANITFPAGLNLCAPTVKLKASYGATYTYQWYLNGSPISGANAFTYLPTVVGSYYCEVTNEFFCSRNTASVDVVDVCREAALNIENTIAVYPNPSADVTTLIMETNTSDATATIVVYNMLGEIMFTSTTTILNGTIMQSIPVANYVAGTYVIAVNINGAITTTSLMVSK